MLYKDLLTIGRRDSPQLKGERMKCVICSRRITTDPDGWDGGHNADPIAEGRCCGDCNAIVIIRRLNDFQLLRYQNRKE